MDEEMRTWGLNALGVNGQSTFTNLRLTKPSFKFYIQYTGAKGIRLTVRWFGKQLISLSLPSINSSIIAQEKRHP